MSTNSLSNRSGGQNGAGAEAIPLRLILARIHPLISHSADPSIFATVPPMAGGRTELLQRVLHSLEDGGWTVLSGPMGIGKSHLLAEAVRELRSEGWICTELKANPAAATIPFGALSLHTPTSEGMDRVAILRATVDALIAIGGGRPHVIALDDAPLLDDQSVAVLHQLCAESSVPLIATARNSDPQSEALTSLWHQRPALRIDVEPLADSPSKALVLERFEATGADIDGPKIAEAIRAIVDRAKGNPLFLTELALAHNDGNSRGLTAHLRDVVWARIERLSEVDRHQLTLVAVADPLDTDLAIADAEGLDRLERAGLISTDEESDFVLARPAHPLYGELIRDGLSALRRRSVARELTSAMVQRPSVRRGDALRLAGWLRACGDEPGVELAVPAALEAISWLDVELANELVGIAVAVEPGYPALFAAGEVARLTGDVDRALEWFDRAFEIADNDADVRQVSMAIAQIHGFFRGEPQAAVDVLSKAAARLTSKSQRLEVESERALFGSMLGRFEDVLIATAAILDDPDANDETRWTAYTNCTWAEAQLIKLGSLETKLDSAIALIPDVAPERAGEIDLIHAVKVNGLMEMGRLPEAIQAAVASNPGKGVPTGLTAFSVGQVHLMSGDLSSARRLTNSAIEQLSAFDAFNAVPFVFGAAAILDIIEGDRAAADSSIERSLERGGDTGMWDQIWLARARAWIAASENRFTDAADLICDASDLAVGTSHLGWAVLALYDAVGWGEAARVAEPLGSIRARMEAAPLFEALADTAAAISNGRISEAKALAVEIDRYGARWHAATALLAIAPLLDDAEEQCRLVTRATFVVTPGLPLPAGVAELGLSGRQREVVGAAAEGKSSKKIADELFLSARTVDNHLRTSYKRLGIGGRHELAGVMGAPVLSS